MFKSPQMCLVIYVSVRVELIIRVLTMMLIFCCPAVPAIWMIAVILKSADCFSPRVGTYNMRFTTANFCVRFTFWYLIFFFYVRELSGICCSRLPSTGFLAQLHKSLQFTNLFNSALQVVLWKKTVDAAHFESQFLGWIDSLQQYTAYLTWHAEALVAS